MGQRANHGLTNAATDPPAIRAEMAKTRVALEEKLGELKSRFTDPTPITKKRDSTVAKKKSAARSSTRKKASTKGGKKGTRAKTASRAKTGSRKKKGSRAKTGASMKRTAGKVARQATDVLGDVLKGAASGAARGAAEVVETKARATKRTQGSAGG